MKKKITEHAVDDFMGTESCEERPLESRPTSQCVCVCVCACVCQPLMLITRLFTRVKRYSSDIALKGCILYGKYSLQHTLNMNLDFSVAADWFV